MPPNRRRGAGKAAAAASARRQWKVGDLVLAKVKGFPAWPATVSEPEKWGYSADWKKVLVYFFGTQQIAFCNPADVEPFTEEKKQSLLVKRQGKGADFVRAVQEIIDSYEKSKKHDQVDDCNNGHEVTPTNGGNSLELSDHFEAKDQAESSEATVTGKNDSSLPTEDAPSEAVVASLEDKEALAEQTTDGVAFVGRHIITTYTSRKRSGSLRSRKRVTPRKAPSVERSRSSARLNSYKFQKMMSCNDGNSYIWKSKQIRKSPDISDWGEADSSAFASNGSIEDNGSEVVTVDSDSFSLNEGSATDSGCRLEHSETLVQCLEGDVELSKGLDFQIKAVAIKKKRKLNRKRMTNEVAEQTARLETEADMEVGVHDISQNSQNRGENYSERYSKEDGDEHLPLVKRARVRMSKSSTFEDEHNIFTQDEEKSSNEIAIISTEQHIISFQAEGRTSNEVAGNMLEHISSSTDVNNDFPAVGSSFAVNAVLNNASPSNGGSQILGSRPQLSTSKENKSLCCPADDEAALPPSKRLHRALEAMSANTVEGLKYAERSPMKTEIVSGSTSMITASHIAVENEDGDGSTEQTLLSLGGRVSTISTSSNTILKESTKSPLEADICNQAIGSLKSEEHCKDVFVGARDHDVVKGPTVPCIGNPADCAAVEAKSPVYLTPNVDRGLVNVQSNWGSLDQLIMKDEGNSENIRSIAFEAENLGKDHDTSEHFGTSPKLLGSDNESAEVASQNGTSMIQYSAKDAVHENSESLISQIDDNSQANNMHEVANDVKYDQGPKEDATYVSASEDHSDDKDNASVQSSMFPAGVDSPAPIGAPNTSICHVSTSESANNQNSNCCSPITHVYQKKTSVADEKIESVVPQRPKSIGKESSYAEAHAALSSFEGTLGSLTRTKESIGRATRIAIDCAKFGVSAKVVEILAHNLENDSSLHRRLDLFFLVDSITQCSRGLKGDVGGIYPSAIQAVLPRLLSAAAPPGGFALENRRQCMKVLRLWLERRVLPESIIRHHIRELDSINTSSSAGPYSRRSARTERSLDDPVRDMEGMLVDEYGSNSSFQLPGFCMPRMLKDEDEGSDSDGGSFEAVTPEHNSETPEEQEITLVTEKHTHILEDVDGELEMEDVAPSCEVELNSCVTGVNVKQNLHEHFEDHFSHPFAPPLPHNGPPSSPPLPSSAPLPPPLPLPPETAPPPSCSMQDDLRLSSSQQFAAPRINSSSAVHYHAPKCRDQNQMDYCDSTSSFNNYTVHQVNSVHCTDGPRYHHKAFPPRPPHPPPSNQFYVQAGQHMKSRRENPPSPYSRRFYSSHDDNGGNFYSNHERMRPAPYELNDSWRCPAPPFPGSRYHDKTKASYAPVSYGGPLHEPNRLPHHGWGFPPRGRHHQNFMPFRPPEAAPGIWRPR